MNTTVGFEVQVAIDVAVEEAELDVVVGEGAEVGAGVRGWIAAKRL